jgi:hypothetical protein
MDEQPAYSPLNQQVSEDTLADHLLLLPDTNWAIWKWTGLRGTGFPISQVLQLAMPTFAAKADLFLACEANAELLQEQASALLLEEVKNASKEDKGLLKKLWDQVKNRKKFSSFPPTLSSEARMHLASLQAAYSKSEEVRAELQKQFSRSTEQTISTLYETARNKRFQEAVVWQNRRAMRGSIESFLNKPIVSNPTHEHRKQSQMIAKYLQRYCTKNDTIGFFGPLGWIRWVNSGADIVVQPGQQLLATRSVYFETWAIDALGETLVQNRALLPWAIPRRLPFLHLSGSTLSMPFASPLQLSDKVATVLEACDGQKTAREVAQVVLHVPRPGFTSEVDVFAILDQLRETRRITWAFDVSIEEWYPERALRRQLEHIAPEPLRKEALSALDQLEAARIAIAEAAGNVEQLNQALEHLETTFTDLTSQSATREAGKTYAARTLIYEDCRRDAEITLGPLPLQELGRPLALLLASARWFTYTAAQLYLQAFRETYKKLATKSGSSIVDFATFWSWVQPLMPAEPGPQRLVYKLEPEFQKRWATLLDIPPGQRSVHYTSQNLQARVQEIFQAPHGGWTSAVYHSPDVMISATSPEAILRGEYQFVLGELHQGVNTLDNIALASQTPLLPDLLQAIAIDLPEPRIVPIFPRHAVAGKRLHPAFTLAKDWRLIFGVDSGGILTDMALPIGQLVLEEKGTELIVRTRDGSRQFDLLEIFDGIISLQACDSFKMLAPTLHTPRITIDRLVISRETWRFLPAELSWAFTTDLLESFLDMRRWAQTHGMPRHLFVRTPNEKKPYYVDLDSPIYAEIFAKNVRLAQTSSTKDELISISEMLPDPEHSWLLDIDGNQYASELRIIAVDRLKRLCGEKDAMRF